MVDKNNNLNYYSLVRVFVLIISGEWRVMSNKINRKNKKKKGSASFESFSLKGKYRASEICLTVMVSLYVFLLMVIYPFYMQNGFYDIGAAKWAFFSNVSFFTNYGDRSFYFPGVFMFIAVILIWYVIDHRMKKIPMKQFYGLTRMDDIVVAFLALVSISAILTPYKDTVIDGYTYWNMGLSS